MSGRLFFSSISTTLVLTAMLLGISCDSRAVSKRALGRPGLVVAVATVTDLQPRHLNLPNPDKLHPWAGLTLAVEEVIVGDLKVGAQVEAIAHNIVYVDENGEVGGWLVSDAPHIFPNDRILAVLSPVGEVDESRRGTELEELLICTAAWVVVDRDGARLALSTDSVRPDYGSLEKGMSVDEVYQRIDRTFRDTRSERTLESVASQISSEREALRRRSGEVKH